MTLKRKKSGFLIFGQGRSGSNLLENIINSHEKIDCVGELLNENSIHSKTIIQQKYIKYFPYKYILKNSHNSTGEMFGFKLMPYQLRQYARIEKHIFNGSWKIIHLQRKNALLKSVSNMIANTNGQWIRKINDPVDNSVYLIDLKELLRRMNWKQKELEYEKELLKSRAHINIIYEDDLADSKNWSSTANKIFDYLGLKQSEITVELKKTDERSYRERISNYDEIVNVISKSEFRNQLKDFK